MGREAEEGRGSYVEATYRSGVPGCPKCNGEGTYMYDHNHGTICDLCCPHDQGSWQLTEFYGPDREGKWCCLGGCGHIRENEWGNEEKENPDG